VRVGDAFTTQQQSEKNLYTFTTIEASHYGQPEVGFGEKVGLLLSFYLIKTGL